MNVFKIKADISILIISDLTILEIIVKTFFLKYGSRTLCLGEYDDTGTGCQWVLKNVEFLKNKKVLCYFWFPNMI